MSVIRVKSKGNGVAVRGKHGDWLTCFVFSSQFFPAKGLCVGQPGR